MNVSELIHELQQLDPDATVYSRVRTVGLGGLYHESLNAKVTSVVAGGGIVVVAGGDWGESEASNG